MSEFKVGSTKRNTNNSGGSGGGLKVHKVEDGDNLFRILPPLWSLADEGRYYKYWRIHWGFKMGNGRSKPIVCTERKDRNGIVTEHCPICDMVAMYQKEYDFMKQNGASKDELNDFYKEKVVAYGAQGHYYTYAVNAQGEIGLLKLKKTMKDGFESRYDQLKSEGIEANGIDGVFVNIKRAGKMRDTTYTVDIHMESDPKNPRSKVYKEHTLTPEFLEKIKRETQDLAAFYTPISNDEMAILVNESDEVMRQNLMDKIFSKSEKSSGMNTQVKTSVPGTTATLISNLTYDKASSSVVHNNSQTVSPSNVEQEEVEPLDMELQNEKPVMSAKPKKAPETITVQSFGNEEDFMKAFTDRYGNK
jgi:hypothetical protein